MELQPDQIQIMSDEKIVELFIAHDERATMETDVKYKSFLLSIADNITGDSKESMRCLVETYLEAWDSVPAQKPASLHAFLASIMRRNAKKRCKAGKAGTESSEMAKALSEIGCSDNEDEPITAEEAEKQAKLLGSFVSSLSDHDQFIFMSRYYAARPVKEIAYLMDCDESAVNRRLASIKRELENKLESEGYSL